jgi:hypothetical protein
MSWFTIILNFFELAACITGFLFWNKIRGTYWKWFPVYLAIIVLVELTGEYFLYVRHNLAANNAVYRFIGLPIEYLFLFWLFYHYVRPVRKWPLILGAIYVLAWILDQVYLSKLKLYFDSFSVTIGNTLLLVSLLIFFIRFSNSNAILHYRSSMMFWVCLGLLIFYVGALPFYGMRTTLYREYRSLFYVYWYIQYFLNYCMYSLFMIAFIWGRPK